MWYYAVQVRIFIPCCTLLIEGMRLRNIYTKQVLKIIHKVCFGCFSLLKRANLNYKLIFIGLKFNIYILP